MSRSKRKNRKKQQSKLSLATNGKDKLLHRESKKNAQVVNIIEKQKPEVASSTLKFIWSLIKRTSVLGKAAIVSISVIFGIIAVVQLSPRVSVFSNESLDPLTPFSSPFIVSNDGFFPIYDVKFQCDLTNVGATNNIKISDFSTQENANTISVIKPADKETTQCARGLFAPASGQFEKADVSIVLSFQAYWIPSSQTKKFRFVTQKDKSGQLHWFPKATAE
ncbi:MAG TPA: hypothetical protein VGP58_00940 [Pyrinomonadaceae bacterium]|jgi:hypothetical protein|nr:hypothetical protein [Pyrinomonadaceae bacterium]